jgi:hypothetical protein
MPTSATYPFTLEHATDIIIELRLSPLETIIEPSRYRGYLFDDLGTATAFRLRFDAERLPYDDPSQFLMCVSADRDIEPGLAACGSEYREVEFVVVRFASEKDRLMFEESLSPYSAAMPSAASSTSRGSARPTEAVRGM